MYLFFFFFFFIFFLNIYKKKLLLSVLSKYYLITFIPYFLISFFLCMNQPFLNQGITWERLPKNKLLIIIKYKNMYYVWREY